MSATYEPLLAYLSIGVAILGSLSALALTRHLEDRNAQSWQRQLALANGGLTMGATIWATHYIAATAVRFPGLASHEFADSATSFAIAVMAAWAGFSVASGRRLGVVNILLGGMLVGLGIVGMHYRAMWQMHRCGIDCYRELAMVSVGIVITATVAAAWIAFRLRGVAPLLAGAAGFGLATTLMSYTSMTGIYVIPQGDGITGGPAAPAQDFLAYVIASGMALASTSNLALRALIWKDGLTREQIALVQASFRQVEAAGPHIADLFYDRLFEIAPQVRGMFPVDLTSQKGKLLAMLAAAVLSLHKIEEAMPVLKDLGRRHLNYGVVPEHYKPAGEALLWALERVQGDDFTPATKAAWTAAYKKLAGIMTAAAAEAARGRYH
ncbi:MAG: hypothetical protein K2X43_21070 [Hyphomonadaceae bacterium]|jgi:NO-binding membrane sensor protein with MHYT domain/hemoglobin-like flavoprotein|nr:hypothetical protein [Hyphomonadaceae bacterium]